LASVGIEGICSKLKVDVKIGLNGDDFIQRTQQFGNNYRESLKAKSWFSLFISALDDFMLKVLIVAAVFSITFDMILADESHRSTGKSIYPPKRKSRRALLFGE
jgi:Ca2+ transporting ATPase